MTFDRLTMPKGGLLASIRPQLKPLPGLYEEFRHQVLAFIASCYRDDGESATFAEEPTADAPATARSLFCALRMLAQLGESDLWQRVLRERGKILKTIDRYYNPELQLYQGIDRHDAVRIGTWRLHDGYLYLPRALAVLGFESKPIVSGLDQLPRFPWALQKGEDLAQWLHSRIEAGRRAGVKEITQYLTLYRLLTGCNRDEHIDAILEFLLSLRDPQTGFIGLDNDPGWAMRGHRNNILIFTLYPLGRREPVEDAVKVMRSTLALQRPDGLFHDGGMCANMDAIQLLAEYYLQTGLLGSEVCESLQGASEGIRKKLACADGGIYFNLPVATPSRGDEPNLRLSGLGFFMESLRFCQAIGLD